MTISFATELLGSANAAHLDFISLVRGIRMFLEGESIWKEKRVRGCPLAAGARKFDFEGMPWQFPESLDQALVDISASFVDVPP